MILMLFTAVNVARQFQPNLTTKENFVSLIFIKPSAVDVMDGDMEAICEWLQGAPKQACVETTESDEIWSTEEFDGFTLSHKTEVNSAIFFGHIAVDGVSVRAVAQQDASPMVLFI